MSVDVGDAFEVTFHTAPGATVVMSWYDPDAAAVFDQVPVAESTTTPGDFPKVLVANKPGPWWAIFTASGTATAIERFDERAVMPDALPPLAVISDLKQQPGTLTDAQVGLAASLLRSASAMVRQEYPYVDAQITKGTLDPNVVALAVTNMVLRVLRNPEGLRAKTTGPFSRTYDTGKAAGLLYIDPDTDAKMLIPSAAVPAGVGTIMAKPGLAPAPWGVRPWMGGHYGRRRSIG